MRVRTLLKIAVALMFAMVTAIAAVVLTVDPNDYKAEIARRVRSATGREVEIAGDIGWRLGMAPALAVADIRFANAPWGTRAAMIEVDRFEIELALLPLLSGDVRLKNLIIVGADVLAETDAAGQPNWSFGPTKSAPAGDSTLALPSIGNLEIHDARFTYRDGRTGEAMVVAVHRAQARASTAGEKLRLEIDGSWNEIAFAADGEIGALRTLGRGDVPFPLSLTVASLGINARVDGTVDAPLAASGLDLKLDIEAADLDGLTSAFGLDASASGPVKILGTLRGGPARFELRDIVVVVGQSDLAGTLSLELAGPAPRIEAAITSRRLDLNALPVPIGVVVTPRQAPPPSERVFSDLPLPFDALKAVNGKIDVDLAELITPSLTLSDVHISALLDNGALALEPYRARLAGGRLEGAVSVDARPAIPVVNITAVAHDLDVAVLLREFADTDVLEGRANFDVSVSGRGATVAQIMGGLAGHSRLLMGRGRARTEGFDLVVGGLSQAIGGLFSQQGDWSEVNCVASDFTINGGLAISRVMLIDTANVTVVGEGEINLGSEALALKLSPRPKSTTINLSVPVWLRGTLAQPTFSPDETAVARRLGGLLGATVFPPALLLGLGDLGGDDNPCLKVAAAGEPAGQPADANAHPEDAANPIERAGEGVRDAVEGVARGLRNLLGN